MAYKKAGHPPGTVMYIGDERVHEVGFTLIEYTKSTFKYTHIASVDDIPKKLSDESMYWLDVSGVHDEATIAALGTRFAIHPLIQEDIVHVNQRAKLEEYEDLLFVVMKLMYHESKKNEVSFEQLSFILKGNLLISFQEQPLFDCFAPVRKRLEQETSRVRNSKTDYLLYALMDAVVDNYYVILEDIGDKLELLDNRLVTHPTETSLDSIRKLKREMVFLRKSIWPLREVISGLQRQSSQKFGKETIVFLRDLHDHIIQIIDLVETFKDLASGMLDTYNSVVAHRLNEVMKVLTVISTIFIPLTFITGLYGMNFTFMPELGWRLSYPVVLVCMAVIAILMTYYFRKKGWF